MMPLTFEYPGGIYLYDNMSGRKQFQYNLAETCIKYTQYTKSFSPSEWSHEISET